MIDDELALACEQVAEREVPPFPPLEAVVLVDPKPRQRAALFRERVAEAGEFLLLGEQRATRREPFVFGRGGMIGHWVAAP